MYKLKTLTNYTKSLTNEEVPPKKTLLVLNQRRENKLFTNTKGNPERKTSFDKIRTLTIEKGRKDFAANSLQVSVLSRVECIHEW